jgi:hypothetical protein
MCHSKDIPNYLIINILNQFLYLLRMLFAELQFKQIHEMTKLFFFKTTFCVALVFLAFFTQAQNTQKWFRQQYGVAQSSVYDSGQSLAKYKGTGLQLHLGNDRETAKSYIQFDNVLTVMPLSAQVKEAKYGSSATQINTRFSYTYLHKLAATQDHKIKVSVGGAVFLDGNARIYNALQNNIVAWDGSFGLSVVGRAQRDFNFKNRSFSASYQLGIPVVAYNHRPNFLGAVPLGVGTGNDADGSGNWQNQGKIKAIGSQYFYVNQQFNLDRNFSNGNKIRLGYFWNYSHNTTQSHKYENILSGLSLGILTNFSKNKQTTSKIGE